MKGKGEWKSKEKKGHKRSELGIEDRRGDMEKERRLRREKREEKLHENGWPLSLLGSSRKYFLFSSSVPEKYSNNSWGENVTLI